MTESYFSLWIMVEVDSWTVICSTTRRHRKIESRPWLNTFSMSYESVHLISGGHWRHFSSIHCTAQLMIGKGNLYVWCIMSPYKMWPQTIELCITRPQASCRIKLCLLRPVLYDKAKVPAIKSKVLWKSVCPYLPNRTFRGYPLKLLSLGESSANELIRILINDLKVQGKINIITTSATRCRATFSRTGVLGSLAGMWNAKNEISSPAWVW